MGELILHDYGFKLIPRAAEKQFIKLMDDWYEFVVEERIVPCIKNDMLDHDRLVSDVFSEFFFEIRQYTYAIGKDNIEFPEGEFPIDEQKFMDYRWDEEQAYFDLHWELESSFFVDMKKYLLSNRMFLADVYSPGITGDSSERKIEYYNVPITRVW